MATNFESLEGRQLLAATLRVGAVTADNRGTIEIRLSENATGVKGAACQVYTPGVDGILGTLDDKKESIRVSYSENRKTITIRAGLKKDTPYRIKLDGKSRIKSAATGELLDGNFSGTLASGDGKAGGNFEAQFNRDTSTTPTVRMLTSEGTITIRLRGDVAPRNASNFLSYANKGSYDNTFFTRGISGFINQAGSLQVTGDGSSAANVVQSTTDAPIADEARVLHNVRGTLSFAKSGPNTVTNQFFFNLGNNSTTGQNNLDEPTQFNSTFFTPFAEIVDASSYDIVDAISTKQTADLRSQIGPFSSTGVDAVPVKTTQAATTLVPSRDLCIIYRTASIMIMTK